MISTLTRAILFAAFSITILSSSGQAENAYKLHGIGLSPFVKPNEDPNLGAVATATTITKQIKQIEPYTNWIRTFGTAGALADAGRYAHQKGLKVALGAWLSHERWAAAKEANQREINNVIAAAVRGEAEMVIVGSEVLLRGELTEAQLIAYIEQVRAAVPPNVLVTTADTWAELLAHPNVIAASDVVMANIYPYWERQHIQTSMAYLDAKYKKLVTAAGDKPVWISETGWPSCGNPMGAAVPSVQNASFYFLNFISWARAKNVNYFYFEAYDEPWKSAYEGGAQGACWGVWSKTYKLKNGMNRPFNGTTMVDNWSGGNVVGGGAPPEVVFTSVPRYGSFDNLVGRAFNVIPAEYHVAIYIQAWVGWWIKPTTAEAGVSLASDGSFVADITTGGVDETAGQIAAFLLPINVPAPIALGSSLPSSLYDSAVAYKVVTRTPNVDPEVYVNPMNLKSARMAVTFRSRTKSYDSFQLKGSLKLPDEFVAAGESLSIDVLGVHWQFPALAANGKSQIKAATKGAPKGTFQVGKKPTAGYWPITLTVYKPAADTTWEQAGAANSTIPLPGIRISAPVIVKIGDSANTSWINLNYTATKGKSGVGKN